MDKNLITKIQPQTISVSDELAIDATRLRHIDDVLTSIIMERLSITCGNEQDLHDHVEWCINEFFKGRFES